MDTKENKYIEAVGRRKTSVARVRATPSAKASITINDGKSIEEYFKADKDRLTAIAPIVKFMSTNPLVITAKIVGGGISSQAGALRHAISRILIQIEPTLRKDVKAAGYLKRDPRAKERRKFGLKKARKSPQWSKR
jgi:small subunit ribosomal protein S9